METGVHSGEAETCVKLLGVARSSAWTRQGPGKGHDPRPPLSRLRVQGRQAQLSHSGRRNNPRRSADLQGSGVGWYEWIP